MALGSARSASPSSAPGLRVGRGSSTGRQALGACSASSARQSSEPRPRKRTPRPRRIWCDPLRGSAPYRRGDLAGFPPDDAARYVEAGVAVYAVPDLDEEDEEAPSAWAPERRSAEGARAMIQVSQAELRAMARRAIDHRTRPLRVLALIAEGRTVREDICTALAARGSAATRKGSKRRRSSRT